MADSNKRKDILKAASSCFARYGYDKTTMDDIGKMVGLNKASLYYYYKNKESIFTEVLFREAEDFLVSVLEKVSTVKECKDKILTYLIEWLRYTKSAINLHQLTVDTIQISCQVFSQLYEDIMKKEADYLAEILELCLKNGDIVECDVRKIARSIITVTEGIRNKPGNFKNCDFALKADYSAIEDEVVFTTSLILDGIIKR